MRHAEQSPANEQVALLEVSCVHVHHSMSWLVQSRISQMLGCRYESLPNELLTHGIWEYENSLQVLKLTLSFGKHLCFWC